MKADDISTVRWLVFLLFWWLGVSCPQCSARSRWWAKGELRGRYWEWRASRVKR